MMPTRTPMRGVPRPLPPAAPEVRERALAGCVLGLLALVGVLLLGRFHPQRGVYVLGVSLVFAVLAIWLGVATGRQVRRSGTARPRTVVSAGVFGWIALAIGLLWALALSMFWIQLNQYGTCMDTASSATAAQACQDQLTNSIGANIGLLRGR